MNPMIGWHGVHRIYHNNTIDEPLLFWFLNWFQNQMSIISEKDQFNMESITMITDHRNQCDVCVQPISGEIRIDIGQDKLINLRERTDFKVEHIFREAIIESTKIERIKSNPIRTFEPKLKNSIKFFNLLDTKDKRWQSSSKPMALMLLSKGSKEMGHKTRIETLTSNFITDEQLHGFNCFALSVYEDAFEEICDLALKIKSFSTGFIIAGGIMPTLMPVHFAVHFKHANFIFSGEAENRLPLLLNIIGDKVSEDSINNQQKTSIQKIPGFLARFSNLLIVNNYGVHTDRKFKIDVNYNFEDLTFNDLHNGIDYSTSRGCPRNCSFCSHVHGRKLRLMTKENFKNEIEKYTEKSQIKLKLSNHKIPLTMNITDDDILLNQNHAIMVFETLINFKVKIWGIQTSISSIRQAFSNKSLMRVMRNPALFVNESPVIWLGTDAFSDSHLRRLSKLICVSEIKDVVTQLENLNIKQYHYWILTDSASTWYEFIEELFFLQELMEIAEKTFYLLPNASTLVPYPSTPKFQTTSQLNPHLIRYKQHLKIPNFSEFDYPLVLHEKPSSDYLYAMVEPRAQTENKLLFNAWEFIEDIRTGKFGSALLRCLQAMRLEKESIQSNSEYCDELNMIIHSINTRLFPG